MAMQAVTRWRSGSVAAMLLGGILLALLTTENFLPADAEAKAAALPADLAKIPSDGMFLVSIRVAELWSGDFFKSVREKDREIVRETQAFEKKFGLTLDQVERLTVTIVGPPPASREPVLILRTTKPYELAKVLATDEKLKQERFKGEKLYVGDKWSVYPLDDRSIAFSEHASELRNLIDHPRPKEKNALSEALTQAAEKHTLVLGVNAKQYYDSTQGNPLPPDAEPFRPLFLARWATLVVDVGEQLRLAITARFANEKDAQAAAKTARSGLDLLRASLDRGIEMLGKQKDTSEFASLFKQFKQPLKATQIEQKGETLQSSLQAKIDPAAVGTVVMHGIHQVRDSASRAQGANNLRQLALAMHNYADTVKGRFPPQAVYNKDGKPLLSWRVMLLPYLDHKPLYNEFHLNEPWDSEHNKKLLAKMPLLFASPRDEKTLQEHTTYYQGFVGQGAFFEGKQGLRLPTDFPDGTSNTIMFVEASRAVPWTKPEDLSYDPAKPLPKLGVLGAKYFMAAICDGSVRTVAPSVTQQTLRLAIMRNDGMPLGPDW